MTPRIRSLTPAGGIVGSTPVRRILVPAAVGVLVLGLLGTSGASAEPVHGLYEVRGATSAQDRTEIAATGAAIDHVGDESVLVTATPDDAEEIGGLGYGVEEFDVPVPLADPDPGYTGYAELVGVIDEVVAAHPDIAARSVIGRSHEGRDLLAVKISDNVDVDEDQPEVLFVHAQHAREHLTVEMAVHLMRLLTDGYGGDPRITDLVDDREIWILPNVNPDGSEYDMAGSTWRNWRKNRQPNEGSSSPGTDLNRNWAYEWGCCGGSSGNPSSITYRGPAPESAPEVRVVADFVRGRVVGGEQQITTAIDFHTYSELILWPFGHTYDDVTNGMTREEYDTHAALGEHMAEANGYTPQQSSDLYVTDGSINDWLWGDQRIVNFTYEMYPRSAAGGGFYPPSSVIERETARNEEAVLRLLDYADCPYRIIGEEAAYCG
ncbi:MULTISPECIES: M14 family metallopeptidase [Nocardiopsidaceae]|uniref:M14 family metallopeptidase n=2 Tax=Nocardiopsidaceae TaxID=83676 RepID=A0ABY6YIS7_9ACTN|nr:M14 family metallopeptidase [Streptomonospora nanhaiensis]WAE72164.1 M14 family metallopeptidase [Streptomonospora nanhaiensis]